MERFSGETAIKSMLAELRPAPRQEFAAELDAWAAAGCPSRSPLQSLFAALGERLRGPSPWRLAFAGGAMAMVAIAVATALVATNADNPTRTAVDQSGGGALLNKFSGTAQESARTEGTSAAGAEVVSPSVSPSSGRAIERSAQITLLADPEDVAGDSAKVFAAVHDARGIVLHSYTTRGPAGKTSASFQLLIPSARLGDTLAALSSIDEVGSRNDATSDITAPTVAVARQLHRAQIRGEHRRAKALEAELANLRKRAHYSHLSVRIESGGPAASSSGPWGIGNAFHDAGHILSVAAGVTLVGLAVLAPLLLLVLLAWVAYRTWLRLRRKRALSGRV